jgi:hypothetical protein
MDKRYLKKLDKIKYRGGHIANKKESALLRKLMSETGKTEEEIRAIYKYRKALSEAAKVKVISDQEKQDKYVKNVIKRACARRGFWPNHPDSLEALKQILLMICLIGMGVADH